MATKFRVGQRVIIEDPTNPQTGTVHQRQCEMPRALISHWSEIECNKYVTIWTSTGQEDVLVEDISIIEEEIAA
jgi:hypothetical protein